MYLHLNFKSADIILSQPSKKTKMDDIIIKDGGSRFEDRELKPVEEILVPKHCVINMLHVLCGLPPVSHYHDNGRFTWYEPIVNAIEDSYIKYDSIPKFSVVHKEDGTFYYKHKYSEMFQSSKTKINSHAIHEVSIKCPITNNNIKLQGIHTWLAWERYLGKELYGEVIKYFEEYFSTDYKTIRKKYDLVEVISLVKDKQLDSFEFLCAKLKKFGKTSIAKILLGDFITSNYNSYTTNYPYIVNRGVKQKLVLSGDMLIKITDEIYDMISNNDGIATLLDGGVVSIMGVTEDIDNQENLTYEGWVKIGTL